MSQVLMNCASPIYQITVKRQKRLTGYIRNGLEKRPAKNEQCHVEINYQSRYIDQRGHEWCR